MKRAMNKVTVDECAETASSITKTDDCNHVDEIVENLQNASVDDEVEEEEEEEEVEEVEEECQLNRHELERSYSSRPIRCAEFNSRSTSDFNDMSHLFHIDFMRSIQSIPVQEKRYKNGTRVSCTFSNEKMRQIERENRILLNKILAQRPKTNGKRNRRNSWNNEHLEGSSSSRASSAAINRRQQQQRIDSDNQILKKKIERIAQRNQK